MEFSAVVAEVVDGDTLKVFLSVGFDFYLSAKIRMWNVYAPEMSDAYGPEAKKIFSEIVEAGAVVRLVVKKKDKFGRWVSDVFFEEKNLNEKLREKFALFQEIEKAEA